MKRLALVLTGGGARAAYQAGALCALAELWPRRRSPFQVLTGLSAGSINACQLAHYADDFPAGARRLWELWGSLRVEQVFRSDALSLLGNALSVLRGLGTGGLLPGSTSRHLLDNSPLRELIEDNVDFARVRSHVESGTLAAFAVTTTNYNNGCAVTFFDAAPGQAEWSRNNHLGWRQQPLSSSHVLASSAIPVFFKPVQLEGGAWYGDGTLRLLSPLSPALHLGAGALLAIGVRKPKDVVRLAAERRRPQRDISFADIAGTVLNAVFLDTLESDLDRLRRFNRSLRAGGPASPDSAEGLRLVEAESLQPSRDLGQAASGTVERFPFLLRHLLRGLGVGHRRGSEVSSYLGFDAAYTSKLLRIGYNDAMRRRDSLRAFLLEHSGA